MRHDRLPSRLIAWHIPPSPVPHAVPLAEDLARLDATLARASELGLAISSCRLRGSLASGQDTFQPVLSVHVALTDTFTSKCAATGPSLACCLGPYRSSCRPASLLWGIMFPRRGRERVCKNPGGGGRHCFYYVNEAAIGDTPKRPDSTRLALEAGEPQEGFVERLGGRCGIADLPPER